MFLSYTLKFSLKKLCVPLLGIGFSALLSYVLEQFLKIRLFIVEIVMFQSFSSRLYSHSIIVILVLLIVILFSHMLTNDIII